MLQVQLVDVSGLLWSAPASENPSLLIQIAVSLVVVEHGGVWEVMGRHRGWESLARTQQHGQPHRLYLVPILLTGGVYHRLLFSLDRTAACE